MRSLPLVLALLLPCAARAEAPPKSWKEPATGMVFVWVPKGCFQMGTTEEVGPQPDSVWPHVQLNRNLASDEQPRHEVCVDGFWMSKHETRLSDWHRVMGGAAPGKLAERPAARVTWAQAGEFAERLTRQSGGRARFRLPTEAEWEYACLAGAAGDVVPYGSEIVHVAWYNRNEDGKAETRPVGRLAPNPFGLHDMLGNVWEWTADAYRADAYAGHALFNPRVDADTGRRVIRGGSHRSEPVHVRCTDRSDYPAGEGLPTIGFRLVRSE